MVRRRAPRVSRCDAARSVRLQFLHRQRLRRRVGRAASADGRRRGVSFRGGGVNTAIERPRDDILKSAISGTSSGSDISRFAMVRW